MQCIENFTICVFSSFECDLKLDLPTEGDTEQDCIEIEGEADNTIPLTIPFTYQLGSTIDPGVGRFAMQFGTGLVAAQIDDRRGNTPPTTVTVYNLNGVLPTGITISNRQWSPVAPEWTALANASLNATLTFDLVFDASYMSTASQQNFDVHVIFDDGGPF